jgi:hypothetical protein
MDKLMGRVRMAERQVARRAKRMDAKIRGGERHQQRSQLIEAQRRAGRQLAIAIRHRHEDWELGPIAPRRDVSRVDESNNYWGTISPDQAQLDNPLMTEEQREARSAWAGGSKYLCLAVGDRVVVLDGPYKGRISAIAQIQKDNMTLTLGEDLLVGALLRRLRRQLRAYCMLIYSDSTINRSLITYGPQVWTSSSPLQLAFPSPPYDWSILCRTPKQASSATSSFDS